MKSLNILSLIAIPFFGFGQAMAQTQAMEMTDEQKEEMAQNLQAFYDVLDLSDAKKSDFEAITKKYAMQMKAVKEEGGSKMQMYRKVKSINKDKNAEMKELLSADQYDIYLEKQKEMQKKMKAKRG